MQAPDDGHYPAVQLPMHEWDKRVQQRPEVRHLPVLVLDAVSSDHSWLQLLLVLAGLYGGLSELRQQRHTPSRVGSLPRSAEVEHYQALAKVPYR